MPDPLRTVVGDTQDKILATLQDGDTARDLTGLATTDIKIKVINAKTGATLFNKDITAIDSASAGQVSYQPVSGDVSAAGTFMIFFVVTASSNAKHYPNMEDPWIWKIEEPK